MPNASNRTRIYHEFSALADYIFKLPRFLDAEIEIEKKKLFDYFPKSNDPETDQRNAGLRAMRFDLEFGNLLGRFPRFMAASNLMQACSLFENALLRVCRTHGSFQAWSSAQQSKGVAGLFRFLAATGRPAAALSFGRQVEIALLFRNCLVHANGLLALSRNETEIRRIIKAREFVETERRGKYDPAGDFWRAKIEPTAEGPALSTSNNYAFVSCGQFRDFLLDLLMDSTEAAADRRGRLTPSQKQ